MKSVASGSQARMEWDEAYRGHLIKDHLDAIDKLSKAMEIKAEQITDIAKDRHCSDRERAIALDYAVSLCRDVEELASLLAEERSREIGAINRDNF